LNLRWLTACLMAGIFLALPLPSAPAKGGKTPVTVRGQSQDVYVYPADGGQSKGKILFAPGDGGWRGFAVTVAETMAAWGYDVYGLDTKRYLESFTTAKSALQDAQVMADMRAVAEAIRKTPAERPIFVGWSEGAGLGVLAGGPEENKKVFRGVVAIGLTGETVLGWRWVDNATYVTKRRPDEPAVATSSYMQRIAPLPLLMIHSSGDEYTDVPQARKLLDAAREPKRFSLVEAQNHRFDGNQDGFFRTLREGLDWVLRTAP
jgi:dienelactone hydrolase